MPTYFVIWRGTVSIDRALITGYGDLDITITSNADPDDPTPLRTYEHFMQIRQNIAARVADDPRWKGHPPRPDDITILNVLRLPM